MTLILAACLTYSSAQAETPATEKAPATLPALVTNAQPPMVVLAIRTASKPAESVMPAMPAMPAMPTSELAVPAFSDISFNENASETASAIGDAADGIHDRLERGILHQAIRLDDFFGAVDSQQEQCTSYLLRWRNALRLDHEGNLNLGSTIRANFDLSKISDRLNLTISGQDNREPLAPNLPEDPGNPGFDRTFQTTRVFNTELRYQLLHSPLNYLFLGAGVNLVWPPQFFSRARFQHAKKLSDILQVRFAETIFVKTPYGAGETTEISLERLLTPKTMLRWANSGTVSQEIKALEWGSEISLLHELSSSSAVTVSGGTYGNTSSRDLMNNYRVLLLYRRNFLKKWLYYELEPQVDWIRSADGNLPTSYAFTFRLEVVFQGKAATEKP